MRDFITILENAGQYRDIEFVCINPANGGSDPARVRALYEELKTIPGLILLRQDYMEEGGHMVLRAIVTRGDGDAVLAAARRHGVEIDVDGPLPAYSAHAIVAEIEDGTYENMVDALYTDTGDHVTGVCWSEENANWEGHLSY